jgi:cell division protein FtsN
MPYQLKPGYDTFEIMGGPDEGKKFVRGKTYAQIPEGYQNRFEGAIHESPVHESPVHPAARNPKPAKKKAVETPAETPPSDADETDKSDTDSTDNAD